MKKIRKLEDLTPDDKNANLHNQRGRAMLDRSLGQYGAARSIVVDRNGLVIAGNATLEAAVEKGFGARVVQTDGTELVVVQRTDLDMDADPRARELGIADNRVAEVDLEWDAEALKQLQGFGVDLGEFWFPDELSAVLDLPDTAVAERETPAKWMVVVECRDEEHQRTFLERLIAEGETCRALTS